MAVLLTIFAAVAVVMLAYIWGLIAAIRHPSLAYRAIGRTKARAVWMILLTGWVGGVYFLLRIRPGLVATERITPPADDPTRSGSDAEKIIDTAFDQAAGHRRHTSPPAKSGAASTWVLGLFDELCAQLGVCLPADDRNRLARRDWTRADELADAVFEVEGLAPQYDLALWRNVRNRIALKLNQTG